MIIGNISNGLFSNLIRSYPNGLLAFSPTCAIGSFWCAVIIRSREIVIIDTSPGSTNNSRSIVETHRAFVLKYLDLPQIVIT